MLFVEFRFLAFFALCFVVHWSLRSNRTRKLWLLGCSYLFYAAWDWRFLALIWASTLVDYLVGLRLDDAQAPRAGRRRWLLLSVVANLAMLGAFKYFGFFLDSARGLLAWLALPMAESSLELILPVGISFYTFQTLSYTIDVYRGHMRATRSLLDLALFVGFFPQLVAGPIVRAKGFLPQLDAARRWGGVDARGLATLFLIGFFKKAVIAENVAPLVQAYFEDPQAFTWWSAYVASPYYVVQLYCDFSGYSDMAIATAGLLGYRLCENFRHPFLASNISDFWRRWHISLSLWLRDYLYLPLGGNRGSALATCRNLMLVMLVGGLWHGAQWKFVLSGGLLGLGLVAHKLWRAWSPLPPATRGLAYVAATGLNLWWFCLCTLWFPAPDTARGLEAARAFGLFTSPGSQAFEGHFAAFLGLALALHVAGYRLPLLAWARRGPQWAWSLAAGALFAGLLALSPGATKPFLYFQF